MTKISRRMIGRAAVGAALAAAGMAPRATAEAAGTYPALARLTPCLAHDGACGRMARAISRNGLTSHHVREAEFRAAQALAGGRDGADALRDLIAADFRTGRTLRIDGVILAQSEAALIALAARMRHLA